MPVPRPENLESRMRAITNAGARAVLDSAVLGLESPSYGEGHSGAHRRAGHGSAWVGGMDAATSLSAHCNSLRGFA